VCGYVYVSACQRVCLRVSVLESDAAEMDCQVCNVCVGMSVCLCVCVCVNMSESDAAEMDCQVCKVCVCM